MAQQLARLRLNAMCFVGCFGAKASFHVPPSIIVLLKPLSSSSARSSYSLWPGPCCHATRLGQHIHAHSVPACSALLFLPPFPRFLQPRFLVPMPRAFPGLTPASYSSSVSIMPSSNGTSLKPAAAGRSNCSGRPCEGGRRVCGPGRGICQNIYGPVILGDKGRGRVQGQRCVSFQLSACRPDRNCRYKSLVVHNCTHTHTHTHSNTR